MATTVETTKMSSKGQIVIPEKIRNQLRLKPGVKFLVVGDKGVLILKTLSVPRIEEFDVMIKEVRKRAKEAGMKRSDVTEAIQDVRGRM